MDLKNMSQHELLQTYRGYELLMQTGAVGPNDYDGLFRKLIDEQTKQSPGAGIVNASLILLQEISARWIADTELSEAVIRAGTPLWYVDKETGKIEKAVVETVNYKDGVLDSFGAKFDNGDFDVFEGSAIDDCFFRLEQQAVQALLGNHDS